MHWQGRISEVVIKKEFMEFMEISNIISIPMFFNIDGTIIDVRRFGAGHINDSFVSTVQNESGTVRYFHQKINTNVFHKPAEVMDNISRVTNHLKKKIIAAGGDPFRETMTIIPTKNGALLHMDETGDAWRTFVFLEGQKSFEQVDDVMLAQNASAAFGVFMANLSDLPGSRLFETIPGFHDTPARYDAFVNAVKQDSAKRCGSVKKEVDFFLSRKEEMSLLSNLLKQGVLPERIVHNDTKFNNVLIDDITGKALCVVDLDTVMPGLAAYDFGDACRVAACTAGEDETDLSKVSLSLRHFEHIAKGFLSTTKDFLTSTEKEHLVTGAITITLEQGIRFLGDYVSGDMYYKTHRPGQNLDRARTQMALVQSMEKNMNVMREIVKNYS
jgi:hypothetical protein